MWHMLNPVHPRPAPGEHRLHAQLLSDAGTTEADAHGRLPLHVAAWHAPQVLPAVVEARPAAAAESAASSNWLPLHIALQAKAPSEAVGALLGANPKAASSVAAYGWLPLHIAARRGASAESIHALIDAYPEGVHAAAESGDTPLMLARKFGHTDAARVLLEVEAREEAERQEARRRQERDWWAEQDRAQRRELAALVEQRVEEKRLAQQLADSGSGSAELAQADGEKQSQMLQAMRELQAQLEEERQERKYQEECVAYEKAEVERLQQEAADAEKASEAASKEAAEAASRKEKEGGNPPKVEKDKKKKKDKGGGGGGGDAGGWKAHKAKDGRTFWYNKATKERTWTDPSAG